MWMVVWTAVVSTNSERIYIATSLQNHSRDLSPLRHRYHVPAVSSLVPFSSADHLGRIVRCCLPPDFVTRLQCLSFLDI